MPVHYLNILQNMYIKHFFKLRPSIMILHFRKFHSSIIFSQKYFEHFIV